MPDEDALADRIRMSDDQLRAVNEWVEEHVSEDCPMCAGFNWFVRPQMMVLPFVDPGTGEYLEASYGVVPLECGECGFVAPFSASRMGVVGRRETGDAGG